LEVQWVRLHDDTSEFDHAHLDDECQNCNDDEKSVVENSFEHVEFAQLDLFGIDLVENLHKNEDLENICEMDALLRVRTQSIVFRQWISQIIRCKIAINSLFYRIIT